MLKKLTYSLPDVKDSWVVLFLLVSGQLAASILFMSVPRIVMYMLSRPAAEADIDSFKVYLTPLIYVAGYLLPFLYLYWRGLRRMNGADFVQVSYDDIRIDRPAFGRLGVMAAVPLVIIVEAAFVFILSSLPLGSEAPDWFISSFSEMYGPSLLLSLFTTSILAPLLEELLFRGILMNGLLRQMAPVWAVIWTSVIFALAHLNPWQGLPAFLMGGLFGWVYYRTGSYWTVVVMHAINNAVTMILGKLIGPEALVRCSVSSMLGPDLFYPLLGLSLVVAVAGILLINKYIPADKSSK